MRWRCKLVMVGLTVGLNLGCSDEVLAPAPLPGMGSGGSAGAGGSAAVPPGPPLALPVESWLVATVSSASVDPVLPAIEDGSFTLPQPGSYLGLTWSSVAPGEQGELIATNQELLYAAARVGPPDGHRVFGRGDTAIAFHVDNARKQPGDFYHTRTMRSPLTTAAGDALVVVRALGRRNTPEVELWSTDGELVLNLEDVTKPDLVAGTDETQYVGIPVLVMGEAAPMDVAARVVGDQRWHDTVETYPALAGGAVTQLGFRLEPKIAVPMTTTPISVSVEVSSPSLEWSYAGEVLIDVVAAGSRYRRTRRSAVDGSIQYYAVMPPSVVASGSSYGLVLSLHGAGVQASGQAASYSPKPWAYLVAATNRRPFGFDWEEWGRLDAIETLDDALATLPIDETRVHLTGHSMGGHGSWHVGVHFADRFGVIAPSAGWISFETYGGPPHPSGPVGRARAASKTLDYIDNLAQSSVYIIHGSADDNVPVWHGQQMFANLGPITSELAYHEEPGAGHWWDADTVEEGADCVDWEPMISVMEARTRDPVPLDFDWVTPAPWVNPRHSFVTVQSVLDPMTDCSVTSQQNGNDVVVTTTNVRALVLDGEMLGGKGVATAVVDSVPYAVAAVPIAVGPQTGKTSDRSGPLNQVFQRPFCLVWEDTGHRAYREYAAFLLSWWAIIGNGHGCGMPVSALTDVIAADNNLVFLGAADPGGLPIRWDAGGADVGTTRFDDVAMAFVYPGQPGHLNAWVSAASGSEQLLFRYVPFSSRAGMPDFFVWDGGGSVASGFFDADWQLNPAFTTGL